MASSDAANAWAFADLARGFCAWCESESLGPKVERTAASWLARLYAAALALPPTGPENDGNAPELAGPDVAQARANLGRYRGYLYREVFDPDPMAVDEPSMGDLGDDLLDIYGDLKRGLLLFLDGQVAEALWHWQFNHRVHWGHHAAGALYALHCLVVAKDEEA
jgi:hypothetical protein